MNALALDEGFTRSSDGLRLYHRSLSAREGARTRAHVAVVHGYGEHSGRYRETMERLAGAGFAAHAIDLRGHGQSEGVRAHVGAFSEYLADLEALWAIARERAAGQKLFVLGHSLGSLVVARWLLGRKELPAGAVLCSPFMGLAFEPPRFKVEAARLLNRLVPALHLGNELKLEQLTHDPEILRATASDPLYQHVTTPRWLFETLEAQRQVFERAMELALPCLVLIGEEDPIAAPRAGRRLFAMLGSADKTLKTYAPMFHELHNELGREQVFADILSWLDRHCQ